MVNANTATLAAVSANNLMVFLRVVLSPRPIIPRHRNRFECDSFFFYERAFRLVNRRLSPHARAEIRLSIGTVRGFLACHVAPRRKARARHGWRSTAPPAFAAISR